MKEVYILRVIITDRTSFTGRQKSNKVEGVYESEDDAKARAQDIEMSWPKGSWDGARTSVDPVAFYPKKVAEPEEILCGIPVAWEDITPAGKHCVLPEFHTGRCLPEQAT